MTPRRSQRSPPLTEGEKIHRHYQRQAKLHDASPAMRRRYHKRVGIVISTKETQELAKTLTGAVLAAKPATPIDVAGVVIALRIGGFVEADIRAGLGSVGLRIPLEEIDEIVAHYGHFEDGRYHFTDKGNLTIAAEPGEYSCSDTWTAGFWMAYGDPATNSTRKPLSSTGTPQE